MQSEAGNDARNFDLHISVSKRVITRSLIGIVILLHVANVFVVWLYHNVGNCYLRDFFIKFFWVSEEGRIPTWYSACALLFCALLLSVISFLKRQSRDPYFWNWVGIAAIFALMSLDEAICIHEEIGGIFRIKFSIFEFGWVTLGIALVLIFGILYLRFTLNLQKRTKYLFMVACFIYVGGALGLEIVGVAYKYNYGHTMTYSIIATIVEVLEMSGIVIFIYALLDYIEVCLGSKEIRLRFIK